jgi:nitrogen fixation NifU-like protein
MDHFRNPRGKGELSSPSARASVVNPLCGDKISIAVQKKGDIIESVRYTGSGCSISQASASMLAEVCSGKTAQQLVDMCQLFKQMMNDHLQGQDASQLGDAIALEGIKKFPARLRCAILAWEGLEQCLTKL